MSAVNIEGVSKSFSGLPVVDDFTLNIAEGEFVSILGPSGCGKSTVLNIVAGFTRPTGGIVRVAGREISGPGPDRGICFQQAALFPWLTLIDNVTFGPRARRDFTAQHRERAERLIEEFGLADFARHLPSQLSGGMQQRAAIARVLMNDPAVLLMDEPFSALDAQTRLRMQRFLMQVQAEFGSTILFITHDVDEAVYVSDRVIVMSARPGRVVDELVIGSPKPRTPDFLLSERFLTHKARAFTALESAFADHQL
ncbi:ABC transporter ATP-binding protein [Streptosporangium roseum]|uniref:ABC transporter ATP-binding protein n=1 Tax=Streptosporangium roseum TaxID=2001 RepID=UPI003334898C